MSSGNDRNSKADGSGPPPFVVDVSADGMFSCGGEAGGRQDAAQSDVGFDHGGERIARLFKRRLCVSPPVSALGNAPKRTWKSLGAICVTLAG